MTDQLSTTETSEQAVTPDAIMQLGFAFWARKRC